MPLRPNSGVAVVTDANAGAALARALRLCRFWERVELACRAARVTRARCRIIIKPDLVFYDEHSPTGTDPALVEALIDLLYKRGYRQVTVAAARDESGMWLENRDPLALAELGGYRFRTAAGRNYEVADLSEDLVEAGFPPESVLAGSPIGRAWRDAHFRISFAKVKTDDEHGCLLGAESLCDILPLRDKNYHYRHRLRLPDVSLALLATLPCHFALLDAIRCSHGQLGSRHPRPFQANTIIASDSLLLADWAATRKMGLDPAASPVNAAALAALGLPTRYRLMGSLDAWEGWINVSPALLLSTRARNRSLAASRAFKPWLTSTNPELFPFRDPVDKRLNEACAGLRRRIETPAVQWALAALNGAVAQSHRAAEAVRTLAAKDRLTRVALPLGLDLRRLRRQDFEAVEGYIAPLSRRLRAAPRRDREFRMVKLGDSILFEFTRQIPVAYRDFVARVDITQAVSFMNDYLGGTRVPAARDSIGRIVHQAERNVYLPQPNYLVLSGGEPIDVTKLELMRYHPTAQRIYWRTVKSENGSATFDDGSVEFRRAGSATRVTVLGRQQFTLPWIWRAIRLDLWPELYDALADHAYRTFFAQTLANFEAAYEGRDFRIGLADDARAGEDGGQDELPAARLGALARRAGDAAQRLKLNVPAIIAAVAKGRITAPTQLDEDGFRHGRAEDVAALEGGRDAATGALLGFLKAAGHASGQLVRELGEALQRDLGAQRSGRQ